MSYDRDDVLARAQRTLDNAGGDVETALTYAGFRHTILKLIAETWPENFALYAPRSTR